MATRGWINMLFPRRFDRPVHKPKANAYRYRPSLEVLEERAVPAAPFAQFLDPHAAVGNQFGASVVALSTGNVVITSPHDDAGGANAGAVYLFNGATGDLISTLIGSHANDEIGLDGVTPLTNGNYVVDSYHWKNGAAANAGAVTFGSGITGVSGIVSASNSLVGTMANDQVGLYGVIALGNGNYVVDSYHWNNGAAANAGAVTLGNGITGVSGVVSASNSLVGTTADDQVGVNGVTALANGNYVVDSSSWNDNKGAVTFGSGAAGVSGAVGASNSLVGGTANDQVGIGGVTVLANDNYVVDSPSWNNVEGAVTFASDSSGVSGVVSASNSLVGSSPNDQIGSDGVTGLANGGYVVDSSNWSNGAAGDAGAVTFADGSTGLSGAVSASNSLVGVSASDQIGSGGVTLLTNGNYVVDSPTWNNGAATAAGAVTFASGSTGISGTITSSNSLVGTTTNDQVGLGGVTPLTNGNYVVRSYSWNNGSAAAAGAVTFGNGATGIAGAVSAANSLVGITANDRVGFFAVTPLTNGNYVAASPTWNNGAATSAGAVTFASGVTGITGAVSASNSLVGTSTNDFVGFGVTALSNGSYVVVSDYWSNGTAANAGAVTFASGDTGLVGVVSPSNSLVGASTDDRVGNGGVTPVGNGGYVVDSYYWNNGAASQAGAVTFASGPIGLCGFIDAGNSLVGTSANDRVGYGIGGVTVLANGNYVVRSYLWNNGAAANAGAVTFGSGTTGISGAVSPNNSLVGDSANDQVGGGGVTPLANGNYLARSEYWKNGAATSAGAVTFASGVTGVTGAVSAANSLVGLAASTSLQSVGVDNVNDTYFGQFVDETGGKVRVGSQTTGLAPTITSLSPANGPDAGGTTVVITGTGFTGATAVQFGGAGAASFTVDSDTQITATAPAGAGPVDVTIVTPNGASPTSTADLFTYVAATTTSLTGNGPDPSTSGQSVSFTATVTGGSAINGETITIEDASNANAIVASPTLNGSTVTFDIAGLSAGSHTLFAVYGGDATHQGSNNSATPVTQVVSEGEPAVSSVVVNGGAPAYTDSNGLAASLAGQNSVVEQILVTFTEPVTLDPGAFTITNNAAGVSVYYGPTPNTLAVTANFAAVAGSGNAQYIVTFSGAGTTPIPGGTGNVIKSGLYVLNTIGSHVHATANGQTAADNNTGFWALYGSGANDNILSGTIGDGNSEVFVCNFDYSAFKAAFGSESDIPPGPPAPYNVAMDADLNGYIDNFDYSMFKGNFGADWAF